MIHKMAWHSNRRSYLCNFAVKGTRSKMTKKWDYVNCANCLKQRPKPDFLNSWVFPLIIVLYADILMATSTFGRFYDMALAFLTIFAVMFWVRGVEIKRH